MLDLCEKEKLSPRLCEFVYRKNEMVLECKAVLGNLIEIIRERTGFVFVRGWSGYRVNTIILKAYCKQDKQYQVLKPRGEVKKHHDPDNLKQFMCKSAFSVHFNVKYKTVKLCFSHDMNHDGLPTTEVPDSLEHFISKNLCFTSKECFECLKRTPAYSDFAKTYDAKRIVRKLWKNVSESLWNLDPNPVTSTLKLLKRHETLGSIKIISPAETPLDVQESLKRARPIAFVYEEVIKDIRDNVTEIVIDSTYSLSHDFKQYFVIVASFFGRGVPVGLMATKSNEVDHNTIRWFLDAVLKVLPKVSCVNSDWSLAEIKAIKKLKYSNQICLFHTLTAIRCKRNATKNNLSQALFNPLFRNFLKLDWVNEELFELKRYCDSNERVEKVSEAQIRKIIKQFKLAICDHIMFYTVGKSTIVSSEDCIESKVWKVYTFHLQNIYRLVAEEYGLPYYFSYLFVQYLNFESFKLMSRVGKPYFFSNLRTSMMCESYFNQLKSWNLAGSRMYRIDTLIYIILHKEIPKIKENIRITHKFENLTNDHSLVQLHRKYLPTWRRQWIIEWKNLIRQRKSSDISKLKSDCVVCGTELHNWICSCDDAKLSPSSSCLHLLSLYLEKYPTYYGFQLQRFGKRNNCLPLIKHDSLVGNWNPNEMNFSFEAKNYASAVIEEVDCITNSRSFKNIQDYDDESDLIEKDETNIEDIENQLKVDIFTFFFSKQETRMSVSYTHLDVYKRQI